MKPALGLSFLLCLLCTASLAKAQTGAGERPGEESEDALVPENGVDDDDEVEDDDQEDVVDRLGRLVPGLTEHVVPEVEGDPRVRWRAEWPRYQFDELVLTVGLGGVILLAELLPTRGDANWIGGGFLDDAPQRGLGLRQASAREEAQIASDVLTTALVSWTLVVDSAIIAGAAEGAWDVAWQIGLISLEALVINHALSLGISLLARRERPMVTRCREEAGYQDPACDEPPQADSFYSGHTSTAFTSASLICLHHDELNLFGSQVADGAMCVTAMAAAAATGFLRVMSDQAYLSDVLTGAAVGFLSGYLIPWLLHFSGGALPELRGPPELPPVAVLPMASDHMVGAVAAGIW